MAIPGADRFLNCVLNRSEKDLVLKILVLMLIVLGTPAYMLYGMIKFQIQAEYVYTLDMYYTIVLLMGIVAVFLIFNMISALIRHHERDVEWMSSLIEYANHFGKDVSALVDIRDEFLGLTSRKYLRMAFWLFVAVTVADTVQMMYYAFYYMEEDVAIASEMMTALVILVSLSISNGYVYYTMWRVDTLQCSFTEVFAEMMSEEEHILQPMERRCKEPRLWIHVVLMIATLGIYTQVFALMTVHKMNLHIKGQWRYERSVLEWMGRKDGAVGVEKVEKVHPGGFLNQLKRVM